MDIHQDKQIRTYTDRELFRRLMAYAVPHWKAILLSVAMAGVLVAATLAQPYLIKVAIDDRINGLHKPMIAAPQQEAAAVRAQLEQADWHVQEEIYWRDRVYFRIGSAPAQAIVPDGAVKAHIADDREGKLLREGWPGAGEAAGGAVGVSDGALVGDAASAAGASDGEPVGGAVNTDGGSDDASVGGAMNAGDAIAATAIRLTPQDVDLFRASDLAGFLQLGVLFLICVVVAAVLNFYQMDLLQRTGQTIIFTIRETIFRHFTRMSVSFYDKNPVGRLVTRVAHDVEALNQLYSQVIVNLIKDICMILGIIVVMLSMSLKLSLISFAVIPVLAVVTFYYRNLVREAQRRARVILSRLNAFLAENLSGMRIIQLFNREDKQNEAFTAMNEDYYKAGMRGTVINSIFKPTIGFFGSLALAIVIWYGGKGVLEQAVTFGVVYAFTQYVQQFYKPLMGIAERYNQIQTAMASAERIFDMMEEEPTVTNAERPQALPAPLRGAIEFDRVRFAYERDEWVLRDVSFRAEPGQTIAFVGATGAGKSSVISLLNRFYDIRQGAIRIDGVDVRETDLHDLRRRIGIIHQEAFVFTGDVYFNIRLHNEAITDEAIERAAAALKMDAFIERLPQGFRTPLGEQGYTLSSGQRQLLAFLRVYVNKPDILILDEATANIDSETEQLVQRGLAEISRGRTTLIVAHRLSTIRQADKIIVMSKGRVCEAGHHDELIELGGYYCRLYDLQTDRRDRTEGGHDGLGRPDAHDERDRHDRNNRQDRSERGRDVTEKAAVT